MAGWTGRWTDGAAYLLDPAQGSLSRDSAESDDLDGLAALPASLEAAVRSGSWGSLVDVPLLADKDDEALTLQSRERVLAEHIRSIEQICERFITRLGERSELLPVSRVKRPARRALERLAGHTEDWATRTLSGPVPRRALAVTREENADLYENRMVTELVHPILTSALSDRIRRLRRLTSDLSDLEGAQDEGTHHRRIRLYTFWGHDIARAAETSGQARKTLEELEKLYRWVQSLRGSTLGVMLRGRRTGQRGLRHTNVIANDRHYRAAGLVWSSYEREPENEENAEQRHDRLLSRHRTFDDYVLGLIVRSLHGLGYVPGGDALPAGNTPVALRGPWGEVTFGRTPDGVITLTSHGRSTRLVPLLDVVGPCDDAATIADRWESLASAATAPSVVIYLAGSRVIQELPIDLATVMMSPGRDSAHPEALLTGVPVSPLETTSLERGARAVAIAVQAPTLLDYPVPVRLREDRVMPRRLTEHLTGLDLVQQGHSPFFHKHQTGTLALRRPLTGIERSKLMAEIQRLSSKAKRPGWERDLGTEIDSLSDAIDAAARAVGRLLACPLCRMVASPREVGRDGDVFTITCPCGARWGLERCASCGGRIPVIEPENKIRNPAVTGPGWVERIYGRDALASPCWARPSPHRYICPECRACAIASSPQGERCIRCRSDQTGSLPRRS